MKQSIFKHALQGAVGTALYIVAVASFMFYGPRAMGSQEDTVLVPVFMLMLFVFSAAFTGSLMLGRPILWYLEGNKKEAMQLLVTTLLMFLIITELTFIILFFTMY